MTPRKRAGPYSTVRAHPTVGMLVATKAGKCGAHPYEPTPDPSVTSNSHKHLFATDTLHSPFATYPLPLSDKFRPFATEAAMTRPTLTVVGKGAVPDLDEAMVRAEDACKLIREAAVAGEQFFLVTDGDEPAACYWGNSLEIAALAEEVAGMCKRMALGLE